MKDVIDCARGRMELRQFVRTDGVFLRVFHQVVEEIAEIKKGLKIFTADLHFGLHLGLIS